MIKGRGSVDKHSVTLGEAGDCVGMESGARDGDGEEGLRSLQKRGLP